LVLTGCASGFDDPFEPNVREAFAEVGLAEVDRTEITFQPGGGKALALVVEHQTMSCDTDDIHCLRLAIGGLQGWTEYDFSPDQSRDIGPFVRNQKLLEPMPHLSLG